MQSELNLRWIKRNSLNYIGDAVRMLHDKKIISDSFYIASKHKPVNINLRRCFGIDENRNPTILNPKYGQAYSYQQTMAVRFGIEVNF